MGRGEHFIVTSRLNENPQVTTTGTQGGLVGMKDKMLTKRQEKMN